MVSFIRGSEIEPEEIRWMWEDRIPLGGITLFDGPPGLGKSTILADLAARLTRGADMPDGTECERGSVLWVSAEENPSSVILPRFEAAGGDSNLLNISPDLRIPSEMDELIEFVNANDTRLVIIDPLSGHVENSTNNEQSMRHSLTRLQNAATEKKFSVVAVRHHTKSARGGIATYAAVGSVAIPAVARAALAVGESPDGSGERIVAWSKASNSALPESFRFEIVSKDGFPSINWLGPSEFGSADLNRSIPKAAPKQIAAADFLKRQLASGPQPQRQMIAAASHLGISKRTLERAKKDVGITSKRTRFQGPVSWKMAEN